MSSLFKRLLILAPAVILVAATSTAFAAGWGWDRDAGAKARGDYGVAQGSYERDAGFYRSPAVVCQPANSSVASDQPAIQTPSRASDSPTVHAKPVKVAERQTGHPVDRQ
jgi:hypothetical protein